MQAAQQPHEQFWISSKTGEGLSELYEAIRKRLEDLPRSGGLITRQRHVEALGAAIANLDAVLISTVVTPLEILADDLRRAGQELGRLVGHFGVEDVLGSLFSSFCIGK